ncbi:unnamed protein product [Paramecium sonneborni]|uniref:IBB domain-containing protein n=1 Tax=Paramecium sonneborni TaxID=65129 RepID=A0A8S1RJW2_9CILI|nr:unnamed protein product [Paramecium sonneborni]
MFNTQVQLKREQFVIQIRKQAREEIFQRKRHTALNGDLDRVLKQTPDEIILQIYKSFMLQDFNLLKDQLFKYNEQFLIIIQRKQQADEVFMNQYINHFSINQESTQLFMQILRMPDVQQENKIEEIRMLCINQVLIILVNMTFVNAPQIVNNLLNYNILDILLNDILGRMNTKQKLANNFDVWQSIIDSLCQLFINLLLDLQDQRGVQMKVEILKSPILKIWQYIYKEFPPEHLWSQMLCLQQLLFLKPGIQSIEIISPNIQRILKQCGYVITELSEQSQFYEQALILIIHCSEYSLETTIVLTKHFWVKMILINKLPLLMYGLFINLTSVNYNSDSDLLDFSTEKHLIDIGLLNNMLFWLQKSPEDLLIIKIYKCLNNILTYQLPHLVYAVINHFLPMLDLYFENSNTFQIEFVEEYLILIKHLIKFQKLSKQNLTKIFEEQNVMKQIREILLQNSFQINTIKSLFESFDLLQIEYKYIILDKIVKYQIIEILNLLLAKDLISEDYLDTLFELITKWESECNELNYS